MTENFASHTRRSEAAEARRVHGRRSSCLILDANVATCPIASHSRARCRVSLPPRGWPCWRSFCRQWWRAAECLARCRAEFRNDAGRMPVHPPRERPSACPSCPPVAPAADTCARTIVESKIWIRCADELIEARVSKKASKTPALLGRRSFPLRACGCDRGHALRAGRPRDKARQDRSTRERDHGGNCPHHRSRLRATRLRRGEPDRPSRSGP